jgi:hypothetical protein
VVSKLGPLYKDTFWWVVAYVYLHRSIYASHRFKWKKCFEDLVITYKLFAGKDVIHEYDLHSTYTSTRDTLRARLLLESGTSYVAYSDALSRLEEKVQESGDFKAESANTYCFLHATYREMQRKSEKRKRSKRKMKNRKREDQTSLTQEIDSSTNRMSNMSLRTNTHRSANTATSGSGSKASIGTNR